MPTRARPAPPREKVRERITVDSTWSEDELLSNYGYDSDSLLREVYGPLVETSQEPSDGPRTTQRGD